MNQFETFLALHNDASPFLLGNIWDVDSARMVAESGFKAIATSSGALARAAGYEDGENIPFELLVEIVKRIQKNISIPFSVDMEKGYSTSVSGIIHNIEQLYDLGVSGINIEDSAAGDKTLVPAETFAKTITTIAGHLAQKNKKIFINIRTDAFLLDYPGALAETERRVKAYRETGINGIFVPFIKTGTDIAAVVKATRLPVNVLAVPQLPDFDTLATLGVKRISLGSSFHNAMKKALANQLAAIKHDRSARSLF